MDSSRRELGKKLRWDKRHADPSQYWGEEFGLNVQEMLNIQEMRRRRGYGVQRRKG